MMRSSALVIFGTMSLWLCGSPPARAAKVKVWHHHSPSHHDKAQLKQAVVSSEGALRLSRQLKPLVGIDAMHVWDVVEDKSRNLFVATGDEGKLYKVSADGKVCPGTLDRAWALEAEGGVVFQVRYVCPEVPGPLTLAMPMLDLLAPGHRHMARLVRSLGELRVALPMPLAALSVILHETVRRNRVRDGGAA